MHQLAQLSSLTKYTLVLVTWPNLSSTWLSQFLKSKTRCWKCVLLMASPMPWNSSGIVEQDSVPNSQQVILMSSYFTFICWHKSVESNAKILSCLSFSTELCNCVRSLFWGGKECAMLNKNVSSTIKFIAVLQGVTTSAANVPRYTPQYCGMSLCCYVSTMPKPSTPLLRCRTTQLGESASMSPIMQTV